MENDPSRYTNWSVRPSEIGGHHGENLGPEDIWGGGEYKNLPSEWSGTRIVNGIMIPASIDEKLPIRLGTELPHASQGQMDNDASSSLRF
jgi:hypothetical protein